MFERLMNLDVDMRCLATKAFVAKEELVDKVFYPTNKKYKNTSSKDDKNIKNEEAETKTAEQLEEEANDKVGTRGPVYEYNKRMLEEERKKKEQVESKGSVYEYNKRMLEEENEKKEQVDSVDSAMSELSTILSNVLKNADPEVAKKFETEFIESVKQMKEATKDIINIKIFEEPPVVVTPVVTNVAEPVVNGMDFSGAIQSGVTYTPPVTEPTPELKQVTPEDLELALAKERAKAAKNKK